MNDKPEDKKALDLSSLDFGPAWARQDDYSSVKKRDYSGTYDKESNEELGRKRGGQKRDQRKPFSGGKGAGNDSSQRRDRGRPHRSAPAHTPAPIGLVAEIMPIEEGIDNLAKEIIAAGRTYSVFELARVVLASRERYKLIFRKEENGPDMFQCKYDGAVFLTKAECLKHFLSAAWQSELYTSEVVEVEAPSGDFKSISKCGFSGEVFGPSNFHTFTQKVHSLHQASYSHMDLGQYKARIVTDSSKEAVDAWLESMKKQTQYRVVDQPDTILVGADALEKHFEANLLDSVYRLTHRADVDSQIPAKLLSPGLLTLLKEVIADQRRYPGKLAPFLCRQLSGRHLAVFKWQGKLHAGPSRPHILTEDTKLADRPAAMLKWIENSAGAGIDELWKAVLPADVDTETKKTWYHDLHWMINQGYVILMSDGHIFGSDTSKKAASAATKATSEKDAPKASKELASDEPASDEPASDEGE